MLGFIKKQGGNGMKFFVQFAQKVVNAASDILPFPISLSDEEGNIIGSTIPERIGTIHSPSKEVIKKNRPIVFEEERVKDMDNVLPGIAVPLNFNHKIIGVLGIIGPPDQVKPYAQLIKRYVEMQWQDTVLNQTKYMHKKTLETFAQYVLLNEQPNRERIQQYCNMFNIKFDSKYCCIVIDILDSMWLEQNVQSEEIKNKLLELIKTTYQCNENVLLTFLHAERIILLKPLLSEEDYLDFISYFEKQSNQLMSHSHLLGVKNLAVAVGNWRHSIEEIYHSYQEAERLLNYGKSLGIKPRIYSFYNWKILLEILPRYIETNFFNKLLIRLKSLTEDDHFTELAKTFLTFCDTNMNMSKAAKKLYIHRNTLIYRLQKIETITGLNIKSFDHCLLLYLVLKYYENFQTS